MLHVSTQKLIQKLCALTHAGDIPWQEGAGSSVVFETEGYRVEAEADPPCVRLLRDDGKELESATAADLEAARWPDEDGTYATHVTEMVRRAQRIARGAELAISRILSSLSAPPQKAPDPSTHQFVALKESEPPPSPHTVPEPAVRPPHTDTAMEAALSAQTPEVESAAAPEAVETAASEPVAAPQPVAAQDEIVEQRAPLPEPQFKVPPIYVAPVPPKPAPLRDGFGATQSFSRVQVAKPAPFAPAPAPPPVQASAPEPVRSDPPPSPKLTSTGLFITGFSAVSRQVVREEPQERPAPPPAPKVQTPQPESEPKPEIRREPAPASGADIYKPWS
jgi:hypothetical protein